MKKFFFLLMTLCAGFFASCEEEGGSCCCCLIQPDKEQIVQKCFADEETTGEGFTFTASNVWHAKVKEAVADSAQTKAEVLVNDSTANSVTWLKLYNGSKEAYTGGAGETTLSIKTEQNHTGKTRKAIITVTSGTGSFDVSVVQEGTKADGSAL